MLSRHSGEAEVQNYKGVGGQNPLHRRMGRPKNQTGWVQKLCLHQESNPRPPTPQQATVPTTLYNGTKLKKHIIYLLSLLVFCLFTIYLTMLSFTL